MNEHLMQREFHLKTGEVLVSRSRQEYTCTGSVSDDDMDSCRCCYWSIGIVAATSAAVIGGIAGYLGGAKVYFLSTASYFKSHKHAEEHIDCLELGARVLFEEHDPRGSGEISKKACLR
ncbi:unnamed protein product [Peronospora destructor]|uniref:Uncharacterized protein n=1 Tax=Peronospora destructor TaxID=86335 RepID=A0AAV0VEG1_9STRA|nr:unnamed protein product [Peronospora destructor]